MTLVARPGRSTVDELVALGAKPTTFSPVGAIWAHGDPGRIQAVVEGRAGVQDEGSQLVTIALASVDIEGTDNTWLDLCAGPGGKAALLGAIGAGRGATLTAVEVQTSSQPVGCTGLWQQRRCGDRQRHRPAGG